MRLVLVRHAETEWSVSGQHTGRTDLPLLDEGRDRARRLAPQLAGQRFALVLTSPLQRATETARLAGLETAEHEPDLVEWDYGDYEGRTKSDIRAERPGWQLWRDGVPGGESPAAVAARADRVIERALAAEGDVALVAHGHILRMLTVRWLEQPSSSAPASRSPPEASRSWARNASSGSCATGVRPSIPSVSEC